jgi:hypothetical protein
MWNNKCNTVELSLNFSDAFIVHKFGILTSEKKYHFHLKISTFQEFDIVQSTIYNHIKKVHT